jgi:hypothetical protein
MKTLPALTEQKRHEVMEGATPHSELRKALAAQHPIHDEFAKAYQNLGGTTGLTDWAEDNQTDFYKLVAKMAPTPQHVQHSGGIKLEMVLAPSPLDE